MVKKSRMITGLPTSTGHRWDRIKLFDRESDGQFALLIERLAQYEGGRAGW